MSIKISNGNLQTDARHFIGQIEIDATDGDADSNLLFDLVTKLFQEVIKGGIVIEFPRT